MSPLRLLVLGLTAVSAAWGVLEVPWETAFGHPPGSTTVHHAMVHPHAPLWSPPASMSVEEFARQMSYAEAPAGLTAVTRIRWDDWLNELLARWVLLGAAAWPFLAVLARFHPVCQAPARFALGLLTASGLGFLFWAAVGGWSPPLAGPAFTGILLARAAAAPEAGPPWLGMSPGVGPLGMLAVAFVAIFALFGAAALLSIPPSLPLGALLITLGCAAGLSIAPTGGVARAALHLVVATAAFCLGEFAVVVANQSSEWFSLGLARRRWPLALVDGVASLAFISAMIAAAALLVGGFRRLRKKAPCAS